LAESVTPLRYETYLTGVFLIEQLNYYGMIGRMKHDGGDIILFEAPDRQTISIHLIESSIPLYEIRSTLQYNEQQGIHTLFILWCDMLLPYEGQRCVPDDWMEALYTLYSGCIYAYETIGNETFVFPVYFRGEGGVKTIEYGTIIRPQALMCRVVSTNQPGFQAAWRVADFGGKAGQAHDPEQERVDLGTLAACYTLLGVSAGDPPDTVKKAYRLLARHYHPDRNPSPDATAKMQQLNEAYDKIMKSLT
jgi:hypothetical protein